MPTNTMPPLKFTATKAENVLMGKIATRAIALCRDYGIPDYDTMDCHMDIEATHCNGCPLDLEKLLAFDNGNFGHDVFGIRRHLSRFTGKLGGCFLTRCAR